MRVPFKIKMHYPDLVTALKIAYQCEVEIRGLKIDAYPKDQIIEVAKFLHKGDKVGLFLCGLCGNGKTTMLRAIVNLIQKLWDTGYVENQPEQVIHLTTAKDIAEKATDPAEMKYFKTYPMLAIDDLGCEPVDIKSYGNITSPMIDVMYERYDSQLFTIVTSNLTPSEISTRYGERMADRFREMMTIVQFTNTTYRHG